MSLRAELRKIARARKNYPQIFLINGVNIFFGPGSLENHAMEFYEKISNLCKIIAKKDLGIIIKYCYVPSGESYAKAMEDYTKTMIEKVFEKLESENITYEEISNDNIHRFEFELTWY